MNPSIKMTKIWFDEDIVELNIIVTDNCSSFSNNVYVGHNQLKKVQNDLKVFREHIHGGIYDLILGNFGPEYANGGFSARLYFSSPGKLYISSSQQSDFFDFSKNKVANEAKMYLISEPILLDNFIDQLCILNLGKSKEAIFECLSI